MRRQARCSALCDVGQQTRAQGLIRQGRRRVGHDLELTATGGPRAPHDPGIRTFSLCISLFSLDPPPLPLPTILALSYLFAPPGNFFHGLHGECAKAGAPFASLEHVCHGAMDLCPLPESSWNFACALCREPAVTPSGFGLPESSSVFMVGSISEASLAPLSHKQ